MMMKRLILVCLSTIVFAGTASAQGNGFSFQGKLNDGTSPANGTYDLQFKLYDAISGGNQIGPLVARPNTVLVNGVFSVVLDFGATAFSNPTSIFIEIGVKPNGSPNAYTILGPRQQLTVVPYAVRAMNATNADNATTALNANHAANADISTQALRADTATNALHADTADNADSLGGIFAPGYARIDVSNAGSFQVTNEIFAGGNVRQLPNYGGLAKALVEVAFTSVLRCYNGVTNSSTGDCGFIITEPLGKGVGVYRINFGFPVANRFFAVTAKYNSAALTNQPHNYSADYRVFDNSSLEVFTFAGGDPGNTHDAQFMVIVF